MSRLMDADELIEHVWREDLNTREKIANLVERQPTASDWDRYSKKLWKEAYERGKRDAQPEPLTDKEQRIFLAAMGREEKACKQVDDECRNCREPYEDSLVRICHKITRKVKGALWT